MLSIVSFEEVNRLHYRWLMNKDAGRDAALYAEWKTAYTQYIKERDAKVRELVL